MTEIEDQLREELSVMGDLVPPTTVSIGGVARVGRRERGRRAAVGVAALAVVAMAAGIGVRGIIGSPSEPEPAVPVSPTVPLTPPTPAPAAVGDLPLGAPTDLPWWADGVLHVDGTTIDVPRVTRILAAGGTTVVARRNGCDLVDGTALVPIPQCNENAQLAADGQTLVYQNATADAFVAYDVDAQRTAGRPVSMQSFGPNLLEGVLNDGRFVYYVIDSEATNATVQGNQGYPGVPSTGTSTGLDLPNNVFATGWPGGVAYTELGEATETVLADVDSDGGLTPRATLSSSDPVWNAAGAQILDSTFIRPTVQGPFPDGFAATLLPVPGSRGAWMAIGWESDGAVVIGRDGIGRGGEGTGRTTTGKLVRCQVPALTCERVADGPTGDSIVPSVN